MAQDGFQIIGSRNGQFGQIQTSRPVKMVRKQRNFTTLKVLPFLVIFSTWHPACLPTGGWRSVLTYCILGPLVLCQRMLAWRWVLLCCKASQMPPPLRSPPGRSRVSSGSSVTLPCRVWSPQTGTLGLEFQGNGGCGVRCCMTFAQWMMSDARG